MNERQCCLFTKLKFYGILWYYRFCAHFTQSLSCYASNRRKDRKSHYNFFFNLFYSENYEEIRDNIVLFICRVPDLMPDPIHVSELLHD